MLGVSVIVKDQAGLGVTTDAKGEFKLKNVVKGEFILVSFIGYEQARVLIDKEKHYFIYLKPAENQLDHVVVKAYGTTSKRFNTGSIVTVTGKEIANQPVMNPILALQGKVPGMVITQTDGDPTSPIKIEIRGRGSINPNMTGEPLYIIDGIPTNVMDAGTLSKNKAGQMVSPGLDQAGLTTTYTKGISPLFGMNMDNIESISVLKDADATAIYGSRGANGVIIINTKRGRAGKTSVTANLSKGVTSISRYFKMLDIKDYLALRREALANDGLTPSATPGDPGFAPDLMLWDTTRNVNWQKELWGKPASFTNLSTSISGGTASTTFSAGASYSKSNDLSNTSNASQNTSINTSVSTRALNDKLSINLQLSISNSRSDKNGVISYAAITLPPNAPELFKPDGEINWHDYYQAYGASISALPTSGYYNTLNSKTTVINGGTNITYNIAKGFDFSTTVGFMSSNNSGTNKNPIKSNSPYGPSPIRTGMSTFGQTKINTFSAEPKLSYSTQIRDSRFDIFAGVSYSESKTAATTVTAKGYTSDDLMGSMSYATNITGDDRLSEYKYAGMFAGIGYRLKDRYLVNLNGRRDGSSRFGPGKEFGNFGSIGVGWVVSDEPFAKKILPSFVSFLKLQSSYGITGSDGVGDYQYLQQWGNAGTSSGYLSYDDIAPVYPLLLAKEKIPVGNQPRVVRQPRIHRCSLLS